MSDILTKISGPVLILDLDEVSKFLDSEERLKIGVLEELAWVEGKLPPFSLLMCPNLIDIPD